jgi:hypothetical protein
MNASGHSDVCVCVTAKPRGLRRRSVQGVTYGHPVGPARAGHSGIEAPHGEVFYPPLRFGPQDVVGERTQVEYESTFQFRSSRSRPCCTINEHRRHQGRRELSDFVRHVSLLRATGFYILCCIRRLFPPTLRKEVFYAFRRDSFRA